MFRTNKLRALATCAVQGPGSLEINSTHQRGGRFASGGDHGLGPQHTCMEYLEYLRSDPQRFPALTHSQTHGHSVVSRQSWQVKLSLGQGTSLPAFFLSSVRWKGQRGDLWSYGFFLV